MAIEVTYKHQIPIALFKKTHDFHQLLINAHCIYISQEQIKEKKRAKDIFGKHLVNLLLLYQRDEHIEILREILYLLNSEWLTKSVYTEVEGSQYLKNNLYLQLLLDAQEVLGSPEEPLWLIYTNTATTNVVMEHPVRNITEGDLVSFTHELMEIAEEVFLVYKVIIEKVIIKANQGEDCVSLLIDEFGLSSDRFFKLEPETELRPQMKELTQEIRELRRSREQLASKERRHELWKGLNETSPPQAQGAEIVTDGNGNVIGVVVYGKFQWLCSKADIGRICQYMADNSLVKQRGTGLARKALQYFPESAKFNRDKLSEQKTMEKAVLDAINNAKQGHRQASNLDLKASAEAVLKYW